jgi:hypothetical protein
MPRVAPVLSDNPFPTAIHHILTNPVYAGAYVYGKTKHERYLDEGGISRNGRGTYASANGPCCCRSSHRELHQNCGRARIELINAKG